MNGNKMSDRIRGRTEKTDRFAGATEESHRQAIQQALADDPDGYLRWWIKEAEALLDEVVRLQQKIEELQSNSRHFDESRDVRGVTLTVHEWKYVLNAVNDLCCDFSQPEKQMFRDLRDDIMEQSEVRLPEFMLW